jgi:hypothetical protein
MVNVEAIWRRVAPIIDAEVERLLPEPSFSSRLIGQHSKVFEPDTEMRTASVRDQPGGLTTGFFSAIHFTMPCRTL